MPRKFHDGDAAAESHPPRDDGDLRAPRPDFAAENARARELARLLIEHVATMEAGGFDYCLGSYALCVATGCVVSSVSAVAETDADWSYRTENDLRPRRAA
jgi:hypothetical protein